MGISLEIIWHGFLLMFIDFDDEINEVGAFIWMTMGNGLLVDVANPNL